MRDVFIGSVAVRRGDVTAYQLRSRYRALGGAAAGRRRRRITPGDLASVVVRGAGLPRPATQLPVVDGRGRLRVIKEDRPDEIVHRARVALASRGWRSG